MYSAYQNKCDP